MPLVLLHIETATEVCSTCLSEGGQILAKKESSERYIHASFLTKSIETMMLEVGKQMEDLDAVSLSSGPGSFTGLRVGSSTAKGICYALGKPLIAVDTLQAMAHKAVKAFPKMDLFCPMIDARRMEVYCAILNKKNSFLVDTHAKILDEHSFDDFLDGDKQMLYMGNGAEKFKDIKNHKNAHFAEIFCGSENLVELALEKYEKEAFEDVAYFSPSYIKAPNITTPRKRI